MGFELETSMTQDKRSINYDTNSPCDLFVHVIKCMYYSKNSELKITLLLVKYFCKHRMSTWSK